MTAAAKAPAARKAARSKATPRKPAGGNGNGAAYEPPTSPSAPSEHVVVEKTDIPTAHPIYGDKKLYVYQPKDGSSPIEFPHISVCRPTPLFFYENRNKDEMHQAFAWMDLSGIPTHIGRRVFLLPDEEQAVVLREWFGGLSLTPAQGVTPPGES